MKPTIEAILRVEQEHPEEAPAQKYRLAVAQTMLDDYRSRHAAAPSPLNAGADDHAPAPRPMTNISPVVPVTLPLGSAVRVLQLAVSCAEGADDEACCREFADHLDPESKMRISSPFAHEQTLREFVDTNLKFLADLRADPG